jgi:DNA-binding MarR family transcriptional regulator
MLTIMEPAPGKAQSSDSCTRQLLVSSNAKLPASLSRLYARPGFLLRRAHQISAAVFEDECRETGLTPAQFGVLTVLKSHPGLGQSSLARALGFDKVTVLRVLRGLEARGFVARAPALDNKRNVCVALTAEGAEILGQAQRPAEKAYKRLLAPLDKDQQEQLVYLLQLLTGELEDDARAAFVPPRRG